MARQSLSGWRLKCAVGVGVAWLALVLAGYDRPPDALQAPPPAPAAPALDPQDVAHRLPGTWLREQVEAGVHARRLLRLAPDGEFQEHVHIVDASGKVWRQEHAGIWLYDGTNLKRKYTLMNGRPPSRLNLPFATFAIRFESASAFVGVDHIHRNTVRYQKVPPETEL